MRPTTSNRFRAAVCPVFAQAREEARQISRISNETQILLALTQYTQDYDEMMPLGRLRPYLFDGGINSIVNMNNSGQQHVAKQVDVPAGSCEKMQTMKNGGESRGDSIDPSKIKH